MADIKLGISGSEVTLAHTLTISLPTELNKKIDVATMSDGTSRYAMFANKRRWPLTWVKLTAAQLAVLVTLQGYNQELRYQNNDESATYYNVVITAFSYDVIDPISTTKYYTATMAIEET